MDEEEEDLQPIRENKKSINITNLSEQEAPAVKTISKTLHLNVRCKIEYIDFEGRSDGRSIKTIIGHVMPRKIILVHGSKESSGTLRKYCEEHVTNTVMIPNNDQCVDITSDSSVYKIILKDSFARSLKFQKIDDEYEVA